MTTSVVSTVKSRHRALSSCHPDTEDKRKTVAQLVLDTAERQDKTLLFKYASHALNNSFFLNCLVRVTLSYCAFTLPRSSDHQQASPKRRL